MLSHRLDQKERGTFDRRFSLLRGRGGRLEYWLCFGVVAAIGLAFPKLVMGGASAVTLTYTVRRLHDFGQSGWWATLPLAAAALFGLAAAAVPILASLVTAVAIVSAAGFACFVGLMPGDPGRNRFGEPQTLFRRKAHDLSETFS